jgi:hypothetical protein
LYQAQPQNPRFFRPDHQQRFRSRFPYWGWRCDNLPVEAVKPQSTLCPEEKTTMKRLLVCTGLLVAATALFAQQGPPKSPPATESATIAGKAISIAYSSPRVKGREGHIFTKDGLIGHDPTYPVWRAGANAATTLHTDADLAIGGLAVPKGDYTLFVDISDPDNWVLIFNKATGEWGLKYDPAQDLGKVKMKMSKPLALVENLKYTLTGLGGTTGKLTLEWENRSASVLIAVH